MGVNVNVVTRIEKSRFSWYGRVERMDEIRFNKQIYDRIVKNDEHVGMKRLMYVDSAN